MTELPDFIKAAIAHHAENATDVRCPHCNIPAGAFCVDARWPMTSKVRTNEPHAERTAISAEYAAWLKAEAAAERRGDRDN